MRARRLLGVVSVSAVAVGSTGCGGSASATTPSGPVDAASGPADAGVDGAVASSDSSADDASDAQSADDATYSGVVLAIASQTANAYGVFADFAPGAGFGIAECYADAGPCCCFQGAHVLPGFDTPSAGTVTVTDDAGAVATLSPAAVFVAEGGQISTSFQGTWDLGQPWFDFPGVYMLMDTISGAGGWSPGDALQASATGGKVHGFSGALQTGALFAGVTPVIGMTTVVVNRSVDFTVAWTPEGRAGESVMLMLQQIASNGALTCYCKVPDSAGTVTMGASMLAGFGTQQLSGSVRLERLIESTAPCDNASIDLVSEVSESAYVTFQ